jgi:hypothetical protein
MPGDACTVTFLPAANWAVYMRAIDATIFSKYKDKD